MSQDATSTPPQQYKPKECPPAPKKPPTKVDSYFIPEDHKMRQLIFDERENEEQTNTTVRKDNLRRADKSS